MALLVHDDAWWIAGGLDGRSGAESRAPVAPPLEAQFDEYLPNGDDDDDDFAEFENEKAAKKRPVRKKKKGKSSDAD